MRKTMLMAACGLPLLLCPLLLKASPSTLEQALLWAESYSAELAANDRQAEALAHLAEAAMQLPDPKLRLGLENLPVGGENAHRLTREGMTMQRAGFMQQYVSHTKRERKSATFIAEARQTAAGKDLIRARLQRETARAWLALALSEKTLALTRKLLAETRRQIDVQKAALANQSAGASSLLDSQLFLTAITNEEEKARRDIDVAQAKLLNLTGQQITAASGPFPLYRELAVRRDRLAETVQSHPEVLQALLAAESAKAKSGQSAVAAIPDVGIEVYYARRADGYDDMAGVMLTVDLPLFQGKRQDKDHAATIARAFEANERLTLLIREHQAGLLALLAQYDAAKAIYLRQLNEVLPLLKKKVGLVEAQYRSGTSGLVEVLAVRREWLNAEISASNAEKNLADIWAAIHYLKPREVKA